MARVVTITSIAVERDSRTYKFAASVARLGHDSVVVEGQRSAALPDQLPFELISPERPEEAPWTPAEHDGGAEDRPALIARAAQPLHHSWLVSRSYLGDYRRRNRETAALLPEADVYWLHAHRQFPSVYRRARRAKARFLYDAPDAFWEPGQTPVADRTARALLRLTERMERYCARRAEGFTTVSNGLAEILEKRFGRRPEVIRNAHDSRLDEDPPEGIRATAGVGDDDFLAVMTGNLKPGMAIGEALEAMRGLPDRVHLAFVGRGHEATRPAVDELGLSERVHLLGSVPPTEIVRFIAGADASPILYRAASANYLHSLPNGFFHAIAAGLPILYPDLPEIKALGTEHGLGVEIDATDPASIAAGLRALSEDPDAAARHRASVEEARKVLNWEHEEAVLARILDPQIRLTSSTHI